MKIIMYAGAFLAITSCAVTPEQPKMPQERASAVVGTMYQLASDPVVCWAAEGAAPQLRPYAAAEKERRHIPCPDAIIAAGRGMVLRFEETVRGLKSSAQAAAEAEARQAQANQERIDSAKAVAGRIFDFMLVLGGAYVIGQAMTPPPPRPVTCTTHYSGSNASTTCF